MAPVGISPPAVRPYRFNRTPRFQQTRSSLPTRICFSTRTQTVRRRPDLSKDDAELVLHDYFKGGEARAAGLARWRASDRRSRQRAHRPCSIQPGWRHCAAANQVIGHVTKLAGNATAIRNGVSIILHQGDNVEKGDVVQSGADSTLGITFIDGTVFGLSSNARMVLNEMVYDPTVEQCVADESLVAGTISFAPARPPTRRHGRQVRRWHALRGWSRSTSTVPQGATQPDGNSRSWSNRTVPPAHTFCSTRPRWQPIALVIDHFVEHHSRI